MHDVGVGNDVGDKAVAYFSRALMSNSTVTSLCLRGLFHCYLSAVMCVHNISKDKCCILTTADNISDYGMTDLSEGLTKNSTSSVLDLGGSCLYNILNETLYSLSSENKISDHGITQLSRALITNTTLTKLK